MNDFIKYTEGLPYLWMLIFIMISAGLAKEYNLFAPAYAYVKNTFKSNKFVVVLLSAIGGILPIEGRVTVSAGLLDTVAPKCGHGREKMGIVDYLATHHYYMWSPLEKSVILPIAVLGVSYMAWIGMILPLLLVTFAFIAWYIWYQVHNEEIVVVDDTFKISAVVRNVLPMFAALGIYIYVGGSSHVFAIFGTLCLYYIIITQQWNLRKLISYIKWDAVVTVAVVIVLGNYFKSHSAEFVAYIKALGLDPHTFTGMAIISLVGAVAAFLMGSSSKFAALAVLLTQTFGMGYFLWFFALEYSAYLLSPTHKCVAIGNRYFGTRLTTYYAAIIAWCILMLLVAGLITFI